jgi:hypothetical protein
VTRAVSLLLALVVVPFIGVAPAAATTTKPTPTATLAISGLLQDGSSLSAQGVTWTPAPCQQGVCSRALTVTYTWKACVGRTCGQPAIPANQHALNTMLLGPADVGRTIKVIETATDVRTDESEQVANVSVTTNLTVGAWPAGAAPRVDLVYGVPESTTASTQESFALSPPHANHLDGTVAVTCATDGGGPFACAGLRRFTTPVLNPGPHRVAITAVNAAGSTITRFQWTVVAAAAPQPCASCFHPPHLDGSGAPMTGDWQLSNSGPNLVYRNVDLFDIDGFNNDAGVVSGIHARTGRTLTQEKAICYLSLGSWENFRVDAPSWPLAAIGQPLQGFANERWVDVRQLSALTPILDSRLQQCATKGFDGVEVDNIDGWDGNNTGFPLTAADTRAWLTTIANRAHALNLFVLWKNDPLLASFGVRYFDGALSEQCYSFQECTPAQEAGSQGCNLTTNQCGVALFATAGKWVGEVEYPPSPGNPGVCAPGKPCAGRSNYATFCNTVWPLPPAGFGFAAWRADVNLDAAVWDHCWP